ncbi:MAG: restriction endonuclease [Anaerolineae bacterium]
MSRRSKEDPIMSLASALATILTLGYLYLFFSLHLTGLLSVIGLPLGIVIIPVGVMLGAVLIRNRRREERYRGLNLAGIDQMDGIDFEHYVARLLEVRGFRSRVTPPSGDYGVDIVADKDGKKYAIQVKRYSKLVGRQAISDAVAGKTHYKCDVAMAVTNTYFSDPAKTIARTTGCELVDRDILARWINEFQAANPKGARS